MKQNCLLYLILSAFCFFSFLPFTYSQAAQCPANIDFEYGNFTNWKCYTGYVAASGSANNVSWSNVGDVPTTDRMEMIGPSDNTNDPVAGFPRHCPNGSGYSIKLGNSLGGHQAEGLSYTYAIPATSTKFSLLYYYAIVLQTPSHQPEQMPRFRARIIDEATETEINCVSFDFTSSGSLPGFVSAGSLVYKDWTPVSVDLSMYAGRTIRLEFITSDCTFDQHYGYAYIDVNSDCNGNIKGNTYCQGDSSLHLTAPYGFQSYAWYTDGSFTQLLSSSQEIDLPSTTPAGSVYPVIVNPFPGFGCMDTLYAIISSAAKPIANAGPNSTVCNNRPLQLGGATNPNYTYSWVPANMLSNSTVSNPKTIPYLNTATDFIIKTTDAETGCFSFDTVAITPLLIDTASTATGKFDYCPGEKILAVFDITNTSTQVQWYNGNTLLTGNTNHNFQPSAIGNYWAEIKQSGCTDTTRTFSIRNAPVPKVDYSVERELQCIGEPVAFTNKSAIQGSEMLTYTWRFEDGTTQLTKDAQKAFATAGIKSIYLKAVSTAGCADSIRKTITVSPICTPLLPSAFTPNADRLNDVFKPYLAGIKGLRRFAIYNRYGRPVFETTKEGEGWNGTYKGTPLETGVFIWLLDYIDINNKPVSKQGTVTLIR